MSESAPVVIFLSYAREDAVAARRIAEALRASGLEVWFDENELRGGDAWDAKIRRQIDACGLFVPLISGNTESRPKGYFRLEWKLAVEQTHLLAEGVPFLAPVVIDETRETGAMVPAEFLKVQWTRLPGALPSPQFVEQIGRLARAPRVPAHQKMEPGRPRPGERGEGAASPAKPVEGRRRGPVGVWIGAGAVVIVGVAGVIFATARKPERVESVAAPPQKAVVESRPAAPEKTSAALGEKSIAVLPFASLGADKENEPFADGVHEDVITHLTKIRDLSVISRTSVLGYRDVATRDLRKIASALGVATVLEGSVRKAGNQVKVSAQLIDTRTAATRWADSYEGDLTNVFALQARLAQEIAGALKITLTTNERALIERRPTENQEAYELYLRARTMDDLLTPRSGLARYEQVATLYAQAVAKDPSFALAHARLTHQHAIMYWFGAMDPTPARRALARAAMEAAERLSPTAPETHIARGAFAYFCDNDWDRALKEYRDAERGLPNDANLKTLIGFTYRRLGRWQEALRDLERGMELNPGDFYTGTQLAQFLFDMRRFDAGRDLLRRLRPLAPNDAYLHDYDARSRFALDGDHAVLLTDMRTQPLADDDPAGLQHAYRLAMLAGDWASAEKALADTRIVGIRSFGGVLLEPAALHRALVARIQGRGEDARRFAAEVARWRDTSRFPSRQQPYVALAVARAKAFAGDGSAVAELDAGAALAVKLDAYAGRGALLEAGRALTALGRKEEALAMLRAALVGPSPMSPNEIRGDPLWSLLKDDPRFEEILKAAKAL